MKFCAECKQANPDEAVFCHRCGSRFGEEAAPEPAESVAQDEDDLWRTFIGPSKAILFSLKDGWSWGSADSYYLKQFRKFQTGGSPQFTITWHWPVFLVPPFFWFLYRKMYMYAGVYLLGPAIAFLLTGDPTVTFVWQVIAAATANYLYFSHIREHLGQLRRQFAPQGGIPTEVLRDSGGVQPYVFVLAFVLHLFVLVAILMGPPENRALNGQDDDRGAEERVF